MNIALIIARACSKRIKNKNIKNFYGKPIISYSIKTAINSKIFKRVIVSTDSDKIISISKKFGAETPFVRPKNLADDKTSTLQVIKHAIKKLRLNKKYNICCIYPVSPNVKKKLLKRTLAMLKAKKADFVVPVAKTINKQKPLHINFEGFIRKLKIPKRKSISDTGQFYWGTTKAFLKFKSIFSGKSVGCFVSPKVYIDVNNYIDWKKLKRNYNK